MIGPQTSTTESHPPPYLPALGTHAPVLTSQLRHDIKNPLAAIKVNVQGIKRRIETGKPYSEADLLERLERINRAVDQISSLLSSDPPGPDIA